MTDGWSAGVPRRGSDLRTIRTASILVNALGFCLALVLWWVTPDLYARGVSVFRHQFILQDGPGALVSVAILLMTCFWSISNTGAESVVRFFASRYVLIAGTTTGLLCGGAVWIYRIFPISMDEYASLFQATVFAEGRLAATVHPSLIDWVFPPVVIGRFFSVSPIDGTVISHYWPGFALLLAPFVKCHIEWLLNPLLVFGSILLLWKIAREIFGSTSAGGLAVLFAVASPTFTISGISLFSMSAHLFFNLAFVALLLRSTPARILAAGFVGSVAVILHNPLPHFLFALPWIVGLGLRPRRLGNLSLLALGYLPVTLGVGVAWVVYREIVSGAVSSETLSFVRMLSMVVDGGRWLTTPSPRILLTQLMYIAKVFSWSVPGLVPLAFFGVWRWRMKPVVWQLTASMALTFLMYWVVPFDQGHGWGYRYFHPAWGALPILAAGAVLGSHGLQLSCRRRLMCFAVTTALLGLMVGTPLRALQVDRFIERRLSERPVAPPEGRAVCFVDLHTGYYAIDLVKNDPLLQNRVLFFKSHGKRADAHFVRKTFPASSLSWSGPEGTCWALGPEERLETASR